MNARMRSFLATGACIVIIVALILTGCTRAKPTQSVLPAGPTVAAATATPTPAESLGTPPATATTAPTTETGPTAEPTPLLPAPANTPEPAPTQASTGPEPQPTAEAGVSVYTVKQGDTLFTLAVRFGTTMQEIAELNGISLEAWLSVGQQLKIPSSASAPPNVYIVQAGDTLYSIALRYGVQWEELARINNINDPNQLYVGQKLVLPSGSQTQQPTTGGTRVHVVTAGETLWGVATQYGVTVQALADANNMSIYDYLYIGQELKIP